MNGPDRVNWLKYYIAQPIKSICNALGECISTVWIKLKGGWYCEYCGKIHNRRVYKYNFLDANLDTATGSLGHCVTSAMSLVDLFVVLAATPRYMKAGSL